MDALLAALPAGLSPATAAFLLLAAMLLAYSALSAALRRKDLPPMVSCGVPLVGGFIKFLQASSRDHVCQPSLWRPLAASPPPRWGPPGPRPQPSCRQPGAGTGWQALSRPGEPPAPAFCQLLRSPLTPLHQGPLPLMEKAYKTHGQVFTVPLFHRRVTFLIGPEGASARRPPRRLR